MSFCTKCGKEIIEGAKFCAHCGNAAVVEETSKAEEAPVFVPPVAEQPVAEQPPVVQTVPTPSFADTITEEDLIKEEQEFLDWTHRFLRWERKAWSICGKVFLIIGIVFAALFSLAFIGSVVESPELSGVYFTYSFIFGGMFIVIGIIGRKVADKMPIYLDSLYTDFNITNDRSGNIGMLIFAVFFGEVAFVFFLINFIRLKVGARVINRILTRQGKI